MGIVRASYNPEQLTPPAHFGNELDAGAKPRTMTDKTSRDSDGNLVNVGNADEDGVNVDRNDPRNSNDNLGARFSRSVQKSLLI